MATFLSLTAQQWWWLNAVLLLALVWIGWQLAQPIWYPGRGWEPTDFFDSEDWCALSSPPPEDPWNAVLFEEAA